MSEFKSFNQWMTGQGFNAFRHANCCRIAYEAAQQSMQSEIDQLKADLALCRDENKGLIEGLNKERTWAVEISSYATELAQYASYAEIIGAISHNRKSIREYCDKVFAFNRANPDEEALRGEHESN